MIKNWEIIPHAQNALVDTATVPGSNNVVDFVYAYPHLWAATAKGVSRLYLPSGRWERFSVADGLGSNEVPALGVFANGTWAATSHAEVRQDRLVPFGDGLYRFDALTNRWNDSSPDSGQASGPFMLAYDLTQFRGELVAACFAGGLVMSQNSGASWKNIFPDGFAFSDFRNKNFTDLNNRLFSVVVDSTVPESTAIYAGTAWGVIKYIYLHDSLKVTGRRFDALAIDGSTLLAGTESGLSVTPFRSGPWRTFYSSDGLPGNRISAVAVNGDTIWAGVVSEDATTGVGLAYTLDSGGTWVQFVPSQAVGSGRRPLAVTFAAGAVWIACENGGLLRWDADVVDTIISNRAVFSILGIADGATTRLYAGTDTGIVAFTVPFDSLPRSADTLIVGGSDGFGRQVVALGRQTTPCTTFTEAIWSVVRGDQADGSGFAVSSDSGRTWRFSSRRLPVNNIAFDGCRYYLATDSGLAEGDLGNIDSVSYTPTFTGQINSGRVARAVRSVVVETSSNIQGRVELRTIWAGTESGLAFSPDSGRAWGVVFSNPDAYEYDLNPLRYRYRGIDTATDWFAELSGNFVTALALQRRDNRSRILWAATQATGRDRLDNSAVSGDRDGISYSRDGGRNWTVPDSLVHKVWNFAFAGDTVWAASSSGLLRSSEPYVDWDTLSHFVDPVTGVTIDSTIEIFAVEVVGDSIWIGTEDGLAVLDRGSDSVRAVIRQARPVDPGSPGNEGGAYATPVPFSPNFAPGGIVRLYYKPPVDGKVTIKIYDFSNNLVRVVTDGEQRFKDRQHDEADVWDGRDRDGNIVAVGTYFFVIEYGNSDVHWGKITVIP